MKICKNCGKLLLEKEKDCEGFCWPCYYNYLLDKIEHLGEKRPEPESKLKKFLEKFFH